MSEIVLNARKAALGRLASFAAKEALKGKDVVILNCDEALITGGRRNIIEKYQQKRRRGGSAIKGPFVSRVSARLMKRTVKGMLPHLQTRGIEALKRVKCYNDVPDSYKNAQLVEYKTMTDAKTISLKELSKEL